MNFEAFTKDITDNNWNVFGVEVYENGKLTHAFGDTTEGIHELFSATKSVVSIAAGIVYDRGMIDFQKSVLEYMPKANVARMSEEQRRTFEKVTVHRLMTMSVGDIPFRAEGDNWIDFALACRIEKPEERVFNYSNINTYLVGVALTEILHEDLWTFMDREMFKPMGITKYKYKTSPEGYFYGASALEMTVHDLSKFGLLMSNGGVYEGKRIVSEEYATMATSIQQMNREGGYGYFFWKYRDGFSINGRCKQKCYCLPKQGIVVTYLAYIDDDTSDLKDSMERNILGMEKPYAENGMV